MMAPARGLRLRHDVQRIRTRGEELGELRPEVENLGRVPLRCDHLAPVPLESLHGAAPHALRVVGLLRDRRQRANPVRPQRIARLDSHLDVADLGAEDVVARVGDVRVAGQPGEQDHPVVFRQRRDAQHCPAAGRAQDDLHLVHVGQLLVGGDGVQRAALGVFDDELQHAPVDAARGVDLVHGHLLRPDGHVAVGLAGTRERLHHADAVRTIACIAAAGRDGKSGRQSQGDGPSPGRESHETPPTMPHCEAIVREIAACWWPRARGSERRVTVRGCPAPPCRPRSPRPHIGWRKVGVASACQERWGGVAAVAVAASTGCRRRGRRLLPARGPVSGELVQVTRQVQQRGEVVHRQQVVDVWRRGLHPPRQRLVVLAARVGIEPDEAPAAPLEARHLAAQHLGFASVPAVGHDEDDGAPAQCPPRPAEVELLQHRADARPAGPVRDRPGDLRHGLVDVPLPQVLGHPREPGGEEEGLDLVLQAPRRGCAGRCTSMRV